MRKVAYQTHGVPIKFLSRILWHPAFQAGYPVRFRTATNITKPTIRFNWHWLDVRLPPEYGRHIRLLSRLVKQLRNDYNGKRFVSRPSKSPRNNLANTKHANGKSLNHKKPTKPIKPKPKELKPKPKKLKPKPKELTAWQREWNELWDKVAVALFGHKT